MSRTIRCVASVWLVCWWVAGGAWSADPPVDYTTQVAPIFQKYCVGCHNADDREGGLSLETFDQLVQGGEHGTAILPGQADASRLIRLLTGSAEPLMPPEGEARPSDEQIALLRRWIDEGARGPDRQEPVIRQLVVPRLPPARTGSEAITSVAVSADGSLLAIARFGRVELVEWPSGKVVRSLVVLPGKVTAVHFARDGQWLVTASGVAGLYGQAAIWQSRSGERIVEFVGHRDLLYDAEVTPDGTRLATCSYDGKILLWDVASGRQLHAITGHNGAVFDLAFSPDGELLASASADETIKIWRVRDGVRLDTLGQPEAEQYVVAFSPDGRFVVGGGADNRIRVWRIISRDKPRINPLRFSRYAHERPVVALAFTSDGRHLITAGEDGSLKLWETRAYSEVHLYPQQSDVVAAIGMLPGGDRFVVGRMDGGFEALPLIRVRSEPVEKTLAGAESSVDGNASAGDLSSVAEQEPNDDPQHAMPVGLPVRIRGVVGRTAAGGGDADLFRFRSRQGEQWVLEVNAARSKSPLDSKVEVLDAAGRPILRVLLQAVRDSYFTFRGHDSNTSDGFRLHNWEEMELNQYLYANGEVTRLWLYPRGPDSGFKLYPGFGRRFTYFDTTPISHALNEPCYIVRPVPPGTKLIPTGLPVFPIYFENDDDSRRELGTDSRLTFTAPEDGEFLARITDTRGFGGPDYRYELTIRPRRPDFAVTLGGTKLTVNAGSGKEFTVTAKRIDGFEGPIRVDIEGMPPGFFVTTPLVIEEGQVIAHGTINALPDAEQPSPEAWRSVHVTATAEINGRTVTKPVNNFGEVKLGSKPKLLIQLLPDVPEGEQPPFDPAHPPELVIAPGTTVTAKVRVVRDGFDGPVPFGRDEPGRNLPHGVYVDNIGLNGLMIVDGQTERQFFITAAPWVPETTRTFHLRAEVEGNQTSWPMIVRVQKPAGAK